MGRVNKAPITFDKNFLNQLKEDPTACVEIEKTVHHLAMHPFHLADVNNSVKEILNVGIAKYNNLLNGILLGYQNIKMLGNAGSINFDTCFIHLDIEAEFYVFKPEVGKILKGIVNKRSKDHIGCLVHNTFNVSLPKPEDCTRWLGDRSQLGQEIQFKIISTNLDARLPYIKGEFITILSDDSGISTNEELHDVESTSHKITRFDSSDEDEHQKLKKAKKKGKETLNEVDLETPKVKKAKKKCVFDTSETLLTLNEDLNLKPKKAKKSKKEAKESVSDISETLALNEDLELKPKKAKKSKKELKESVFDTSVTLPTLNEGLENRKVKKAKKKDMFDTSESLAILNEDLENSVTKSSKKRKKHKQDENEQIELMSSYDNILKEFEGPSVANINLSLIEESPQLHKKIKSKKNKKEKAEINIISEGEMKKKSKKHELVTDDLNVSYEDLGTSKHKKHKKLKRSAESSIDDVFEKKRQKVCTSDDPETVIKKKKSKHKSP